MDLRRLRLNQYPKTRRRCIYYLINIQATSWKLCIDDYSVANKLDQQYFDGIN